MLTLRSGGWLILLMLLLCAGVAALTLEPVFRTRGSRAVGDGTHPASYGFDLRALNVPRACLTGSNLPRDGRPVLDGPPVIPGAEVAERYQRRRKYLVSEDRVVGVSLGGEPRAYPLRVLAWHEVVNDTLGGRPIAVTYAPLSDGVAVFDRRVGGEVVSFGHSGLLYNSTLLLYDRRPGHRGESLWSQILARAVSGPAALAATRLRVLPCSVVTWREWIAAHPRTTVLEPDRDMLQQYRRDPYGSYLSTGRPRFPVRPMPPRDTLPPMTRVLAWRSPGQPTWTVFPLENRRVLATDTPDFFGPGQPLQVDDRHHPATVYVGAADEDWVETIYATWFAWYAAHQGRPGVLIPEPKS